VSADSDRDLAAYILSALGRAVLDTRRNGGHLPDGLTDLFERLDGRASKRPDATESSPRAVNGDDGPMPESALVTKRQAAAYLSCSLRTVERLFGRGELRAVNVARGDRLRRADLDAYVAALAGSRPFRETVAAKSGYSATASSMTPSSSSVTAAPSWRSRPTARSTATAKVSRRIASTPCRQASRRTSTTL
jgi:excisionase family DNA binding protein